MPGWSGCIGLKTATSARLANGDREFEFGTLNLAFCRGAADSELCLSESKISEAVGGSLSARGRRTGPRFPLDCRFVDYRSVLSVGQDQRGKARGADRGRGVGFPGIGVGYF
jgi:hypothetical protein